MSDVTIMCNCGDQDHFVLSKEVYEFLAKQTEHVQVITPDGTFQVPRAYIAYHGIKAGEVPALAEKHGWQKE